MIKIIVVFFVFIFNFALAEEMNVSSSYKYKSFSLTKDDKIKAENELKKIAIKKFANEKFKGNKSGYRDFKKVEDQIYDDIDSYVNIIAYLVEENDTKNKTLKLTAKVDIMEMDLEFLIFDSSAIANAMPSELSEIALYAVALRPNKIISFDNKETSVSKNSRETYNSETSEIDDSGAEISSLSENETISQSGGSSEYKSDKIEYGRINGIAEDIFFKTAEVYTDNGFSPIDAIQFLDDRIAEEYAKGEDLSSETKNYMYKETINVGIPFLIISRLKVENIYKSKQNGKPTAAVSVINSVFQCSKFCKLIATVGPVQGAQYGNGENQAITSALIFAADLAAQQTIDMLSSQGFR